MTRRKPKTAHYHSQQRKKALYADGEDALKVRLRLVCEWLNVSNDSTSDILSLCHALKSAGVARLFHSLFADCLWIYGQVNDRTDLSHTNINAATKTVLRVGLRPRHTWLKQHKEIVARCLDCDANALDW